MTDAMMNLRTLVEKTADAVVLRDMIAFAAERLMEIEVGALTGAAHGEKTATRLIEPAQSGDRLLDRRSATPRVGTQSSYGSDNCPHRLDGHHLIEGDRCTRDSLNKSLGAPRFC
jgi:hypothetical protein